VLILRSIVVTTIASPRISVRVGPLAERGLRGMPPSNRPERRVRGIADRALASMNKLETLSKPDSLDADAGVD